MNSTEVIVETGPWTPVEFSPAAFQSDLAHSFDLARFVASPITEGLAKVCELSYEPPETLETSLNQLGFDWQESLLNDGMFCCLATRDGSLVVAFRGTDQFGDILFDLDFRPLEIGGGMAHKGFQEAYKVLQKDLIRKIQSIPHKNLWITGHSLGGAMAVLCGYDLVRNQREEVTGVVTFGQPLLCKEDLANSVKDALGDRYVRFVNNKDIITRVPPNYVHCGQLIWWRNGRIFKNFATGLLSGFDGYGSPASSVPDLLPMDDHEFEVFKADVKKAEALAPKQGWLFETDFPFINDHRMTSYLKQIRGQ